MSKQERLMKMGELQETAEKLRRLESRASGILRSLREAAYPMVTASPLDLNPLTITDYAREFAEVQAEGAKLRIAVDNLKDELGL